MRLVIRIMGEDLIEFATGKDADTTPKGPGDVTTTHVGFVASPGDQRWEKGLEP